MKKLITILAFFALSLSFGQVIPVNALKIKGITSVQRDGLTINAGEFPIIYNTTAGEFQRWNGAAWETWDAVESVNGEVGVVALDLGLTGNTLSLTGDGTTVDLSGYLDNTDDQTASEVNIADAGGLVAATTVEGALQENRTAINLNTAKVTNATHTGEVTGANALTIASGVVDSDNIVNGTIDEIDLDASVNASLDLADSSVQPGDIDTFAELNAIVADKSLANLNDAQVFSSNIDFGAGIDVTGNGTFSGDVIGAAAVASASGIVTRLQNNILNFTRTGGGSSFIDQTGGGSIEVRTEDNLGVQSTALTFQGGTASNAVVLGRPLNLNTNNITGVGNLTATGTITGSNLSGTNTGDQNAAGVSIADAGGLITATDVEGALAENRTAINLNTAKVSNATHTGEVTGDGALTIASSVVDSDNIVDGSVQVADLESTNAATDGYFPSYDSATGGVTWEAISTTDSGSGYSFNSVATDNIYIRNAQVTNGGEATARKVWNQFTVTADSVWLHKDSVSLTGNPFILQPWGADSVVVRKGAATNFYIADSAAALSADGIVIKGRHPITAIKTAATDFFLQGNFTTYTVPSGPVNLYSNSDAANPVSEANSAAGWTLDVGTDLGVAVNSSDFRDGLYSLEFTHNGTNSTQQTRVVDITGLTIGVTYNVVFEAKEVTSGAYEIWLRSDKGWVSSTGQAIGTTWTEYTLTGVADATTAQIRVGTSAAGQNGQKVLLDNIRVTAQ